MLQIRDVSNVPFIIITIKQIEMVIFHLLFLNFYIILFNNFQKLFNLIWFRLAGVVLQVNKLGDIRM